MLDPKIAGKLRIWAEYESSGIWLVGPDGISMLEHEELGLPQDLSERFYKWIALYSECLVVDDWDIDEFNTIGRSLARDLKSFVGPAIEVEFVPEMPGGSTGPPEMIE